MSICFFQELYISLHHHYQSNYNEKISVDDNSCTMCVLASALGCRERKVVD